ncbi:MAG: hypothetical protein U7127_21345 [Phormidium sp.]
MTRNQRLDLRGIGELQFWSLGKRMSNFSALLSLLPLLMGGFLAVVTEGKAEARHTTRYSEECCVVTQVGANTVELAQFPQEFSGQIYRVYVPTYSQELLVLVKQVVGSAYPTFISRRRPGIIVMESDLGTARRAVRELQNRGIPVEMEVRRSAAPWPPGVSGGRVDSPYFVVVNIRPRQNPARLLNRVRSVEPDARLEPINGRTVILVREVQSPVEAQSLIDELQIRGLNARLLEVNSFRGIEPEISSNQNRFAGVELESDISNNVDRVNRVQNNVDRFTPVQNRPVAVTSAPQTAYRLVIPIRPDELAAIEALARQMATDWGTENQVLIEANANKSQLIVGPFNNLQVAQQWEASLQDYGVGSVIINNAN